MAVPARARPMRLDPDIMMYMSTRTLELDRERPGPRPCCHRVTYQPSIDINIAVETDPFVANSNNDLTTGGWRGTSLDGVRANACA